MFTKKELAEAAYDEVQKRRANYPRWITERKMTQANASIRIARMEAIYRVLIKMDDADFERLQA